MFFSVNIIWKGAVSNFSKNIFFQISSAVIGDSKQSQKKEEKLPKKKKRKSIKIEQKQFSVTTTDAPPVKTPEAQWCENDVIKRLESILTNECF